MRNAVRDDACLTGTGAGQNQHRPIGERDGIVLLRVQAFQEIHDDEGILILANAKIAPKRFRPPADVPLLNRYRNACGCAAASIFHREHPLPSANAACDRRVDLVRREIPKIGTGEGVQCDRVH